MCNPIPYMNGLLTLTEITFNCVGYLPKTEFPAAHKWGVKWRKNQALIQIVTGLALICFAYFTGLLIPSLAISHYMTLPLQAASLGCLFANHGVLNFVRSQVEKINLPGLTLVYDFYGRKFLPALNPDWDVAHMLFTKIKDLWDRLIFATLFPPEFVYK